MIKVKILLILIIYLVFAQSIQAQDKERYKKDVKDHDAAMKLYYSAISALKKQNITEAEKLYLQSVNTYPTFDLIYYLAEKIKLGENTSAMLASDTLISRIKKMDRTLKYEKTSYSSSYSLIYVNSDDVIEKIRIERARANYTYGDNSKSLKDLLLIRDKSFWSGNDFEMLGELAIIEGDFISAQKTIDTLYTIYNGRKMEHSKELTPLYLAAKLSLAKGEYEKCLKFATELEASDKGLNTVFKGIARLILAELYINLGDIEKAKSYYEAAIKHISFTKSSPEVTYVGGLIALYEKNYSYAIECFTSYLNYKSGSFKNGKVYLKQRIYTKRAEAYIGLQNYTHARQDYEAALIYNPNYGPAVEGLAKLEGKIINNRITDKTPPEIMVTEPAVNRGLKITSSGKDIMVKGMAKDPSGLKTVSINGIKVYAKEDGNFWGSIPLKEGANQLTIQATDMADNMSEKLFEIEKIIVTTNKTDDIVPVQEKIGTNYVLLIGSQNYSDVSIPSLENPIADAIKLKLALKGNYNFEDDNILTLFNPSVSDFKKKFLQLNETLQPDDNLIIFYAGHGVWNEKEKKGYWLMTDAVRADVNTWLPNKTVLDLIANVPSRHTLLITDACFSGSVFKTRSIGADAPPAVREMSEKISRVAMTSGNDTEVPDQSVFMKYLIKALSENKEKYLTAQKMFITQIIEAVMTESKTEPRYGTLELAGHVGGDFIFTKK